MTVSPGYNHERNKDESGRKEEDGVELEPEQKPP